MLILDDEPDVRSLLVDLLARGGYAVMSAPDGREALRALYAVRPDLVILDVRMPGMDGWETLERIRELSGVPVLMLTARDGELDKVRGLKAGRTTTWRSRSDARSSSRGRRRCSAAPPPRPSFARHTPTASPRSTSSKGR